MSRRRARSLSAYTPHNKAQLVHGGKEFFDLMIRLIDQATTLVHLQTYIFEADQTGSMVAAALIRAAQRKVRVYLLLDGYASQELPKPFIANLRAQGVHFRWFSPLFKSRRFYLGRRLHHKILVVDGVHGLAGGINISDRYNDIGDEKAWLDWALHVHGEAALKLNVIGERMWIKSSWAKIPRRYPPSQLTEYIPEEECLVRVRRNDWVRSKNEISASYMEMFRSASKQITLMSSYFLPGKIFRKQMAQACKRGVKIRVILAGVSDIKTARLGEQYMYRWLFKNNITVYEYKESVLHGKLATHDNTWVTVGSYNVNNISAYASVELNMDIRDEAFARQTQHELDEIIRLHCNEIIPEQFFSDTTWFTRVKQRGAYLVIRFLFFLFTFYFKQEK